MASLPKLKPGLNLYRSSDEAAYVAAIVFLGVLIPVSALLLTLPASDRPFSWSGWCANLAKLGDLRSCIALLLEHWPRAAGGFGISATAAYFGWLTARDEAPLTEPFLTPDTSQPRL